MSVSNLLNGASPNSVPWANLVVNSVEANTMNITNLTTDNIIADTISSNTNLKVALFGDPTSGPGNYYGFQTTPNTVVYSVAGLNGLFSHTFVNGNNVSLLRIGASGIIQTNPNGPAPSILDDGAGNMTLGNSLKIQGAETITMGSSTSSVSIVPSTLPATIRGYILPTVAADCDIRTGIQSVFFINDLSAQIIPFFSGNLISFSNNTGNPVTYTFGPAVAGEDYEFVYNSLAQNGSILFTFPGNSLSVRVYKVNAVNTAANAITQITFVATLSIGDRIKVSSDGVRYYLTAWTNM